MFEENCKRIASLNFRHVLIKNRPIAEDCRVIEFSGHALKILENFCYPGDITGAKEDAVDTAFSLQLPLLVS